MVAVAATAGTALGWPSTAGAAAAAAAAGITMVGSLGRQGSLILKGVETLLGLSPARAGFGYKLQHSPHSARRTQGPMPQPKVSRAGLLGWCGATTKSQQGRPTGVVWRRHILEVSWGMHKPARSLPMYIRNGLHEHLLAQWPLREQTPLAGSFP